MNAATTPPQVAARPALLEIDDLRAAYGGSQVLFGIGLRIGSGDVATLLGRNGMGKTTTVRALLGLLPPSAGTAPTKVISPKASAVVNRIAVVGVRRRACTRPSSGGSTRSRLSP